MTGARLIPNNFAYLALFGWPAVCIILFVVLPVEIAAIWSLLAGYLLLPASLSVDVHYLPPLNKTSIVGSSAFLLCLMKGSPLRGPRLSLLIYCFVLAFVLSPFFTTLDNRYELHMGDRSIPGFYPLDAVKLAISNVLTLAPFFVGSRILSSDRGREALLKALPVAALFYSLPMLLEVRMSPQLQRLIYGMDPGGFVMLARGGGFRPRVFLNNGLEVALYTSMACIAAGVGIRAKWKIFSMPAGAIATYLGGLLLLCKTLGAFLLAAIVMPIVLFAKPKSWINFSSIVALLICAYPIIRTYDLVPVRRIAAAANSFSSDRGGSFAFRVKNEDLLLAKANQKQFFGWGTWGRNRIYDVESGSDLSITDGEWIIRFGMFGWLGYLSLYGLFAAAILSARRAVRGPVAGPSIILGGLTLILAVNLIDLIPNANLLPLTYLIAGSIAGRSKVFGKLREKSPADGSARLESPLAVAAS